MARPADAPAYSLVARPGPGVGNAGPVAEEEHVDAAALGNPRDLFVNVEVGICAAGPRPWHPPAAVEVRVRDVEGQMDPLGHELSSHKYASHRCGRPACRCHRGGPLHQGQHLTFKGPGNQTRSVYVPKDLLPEVRAWVAEHKRLKQLLHEIHQLSLALVRTHARQRRRQAGRR